MTRPSWNRYFLNIAHAVALRSTCLRRHVGAVIVRDKHILATGYNGSPCGTPHCSETGCLREALNIASGERHEICRGAHAEMNAIAQAAQSGTSCRGATIYCTDQPCAYCAKAIINSGIVRVMYEQAYPDDLSSILLKEAGIDVMQIRSDLDDGDEGDCGGGHVCGCDGCRCGGKTAGGM